MAALRCPPVFLFIAFCAFVGPAIVHGSTAAPVQITVEFLPDGRCSIREVGSGFRADLTYVPPASSSSDLRCTIPSPPRGFPVNLTVTLPPGRRSVGGEFPRLAWSERDGLWCGTVSLPAAPAFVRVPQSSSALAWWRSQAATAGDTITFGWNFYGWFVFAAVFIATYFAWARLSAVRL